MCYIFNYKKRLGWGAFYLGRLVGKCQSTVNFTVNAKSLIDKELCVILAPTVKILKIDSWWLFIVNCSANEQLKECYDALEFGTDSLK